MAKKAKKPKRQRPSAKKPPRAGPMTLFPLTFDEAMGRIIGTSAPATKGHKPG